MPMADLDGFLTFGLIVMVGLVSQSWLRAQAVWKLEFELQINLN